MFHCSCFSAVNVLMKVHGTEGGWKHYLERFAGMGSKMFSSRELMDAFKDTGQQEHTSITEHKDNLFNDD